MRYLYLVMSLNLILWQIRNLADCSEICNEIHTEICGEIHYEVRSEIRYKKQKTTCWNR